MESSNFQDPNSTEEMKVNSTLTMPSSLTTWTWNLRLFNGLNMCLMVAVLLFSTVNLAIVWTIQKTKKLRKPFNHFVSILLGVNIIRSVVVPVMDITEMLSNFSIQNGSYCLVKVLLFEATLAFCYYHLAAMSTFRLYVCFKGSVVNLNVRHIVILSCISGLCAIATAIPFVLTNNPLLASCMADPNLLFDDFTEKLLAQISMLIFMAALLWILLSHIIIAVYIKVKNRNFGNGQNIFSVKVGILTACLLLAIFLIPLIAVTQTLPKMKKDMLKIVLTRLLQNLLFLDTILLGPVCFLQNKELRKAMRTVFCKRGHLTSTVVPMNVMVAAAPQMTHPEERQGRQERAEHLP